MSDYQLPGRLSRGMPDPQDEPDHGDDPGYLGDDDFGPSDSDFGDSESDHVWADLARSESEPPESDECEHCGQ